MRGEENTMRSSNPYTRKNVRKPPETLFSEHAVSKVEETFEVRKDARKMLQNRTNFN